MQMKNTRGVQQEEVSEAADALLAAGTRPTIERVRLQLGRGSPNTVAPMLETWFAGLGKRLGMSGETSGEGQLPMAAAQALTKVWDAALLVARKEAEAALAIDRQALSKAQTTLSERETELVQQELAFTQRKDLADQLLQAEREKTAAVEASLASALLQLSAREGTVTTLRTALTKAEEQILAARNRSDAQERRHTEERTKWEERAAGNERRILAELDRERLALKQANTTSEAAEAAFQNTLRKLENRALELGQSLHACDLELKNAQHARDLSDLRCTDLSGQLAEQRSTNVAVREQLNHALEALNRRGTPPPKRKTVEKSVATK